MPTRTEREDERAPSDADVASWDERPILGQSRGLPWWSAILLAIGVTALGVAADGQLSDKPPTLITQAAYFVGCVAAVCWVRRRNLFGPIVQPPLVLTLVLLGGEIATNGMPEKLGMKELLFDYGVPVINTFPAMALTSGATLLIGIFRLLRERDPQRRERGSGKADPDGKRGSADADDEDEPRPRSARARSSADERRPSADDRRPGRGDDAARGATGVTGRPGSRERSTPPARPADPRRREPAAPNRGRDAGLRDSGPHPRREPPARRMQDSGPHPRPDRAAPVGRPPVRGRRTPPPTRPWEAEGGPSGVPPRRRVPPPSAGGPARKPPPRGEGPEPPRPRRQPPPPRSRRWDPDESG